MRILKSTIQLLFLSSLLMWAVSASAQQERKITKYVPGADDIEKEKEKIDLGPLFQGVSATADVYGLVGKMFGNDYTSTEFGFEVNLKNRFFPVFEAGYGKCDYTDDDNNIHYKTSAPFFRVGMNYNFFYKKRQTSYVYGGLRYAYSPFKYDVDAPDMIDPVWGGKVPISLHGVKGDMSWAEIVIGLQAKITSILHMGWTVRYKMRLSSTVSPNSDPWYVPGYGYYKKNTFGATYNIVIDLPFWKSNKKKSPVAAGNSEKPSTGEKPNKEQVKEQVPKK